jgi:tetratricopeptide (TPR) repeat protein
LIVTGTEDRRDGTYGITGDAVNTGARLASHAESDQVLVSEETRRLIADFFQVEPLAPVELKGKSGRVTPYRVIEQTGVSSRFEAAAQRGFTAYAGREAELGTLHASLEKARGRQGQFVTVMGEPGIGKSRLLFEFRHGVPREQVSVLTGHCQSYGTDTPYLPMVDALRRALRLEEAGGADALHDHVVKAVRAISPELERYLPQYLHLLSIPSEQHKIPATLQGDALRRSFEEALAAILTENARRQPMALILEDWHWADEASDSALRHLAGLVPHHSLQVVVSYRPDYERKWANPQNYQPLVLQPLGVEETAAMLRSVWKAEQLPDGLAAQIHARTGGNALFNEEVARGLRDDGTVRVDDGRAVLAGDVTRLHLPDSVHAVVRARIDRLDPDSREVLRLASVIGREFTLPLLEKLHPAPPRIPPALDVLAQQDLIHPLRVVPEPAYLFKHVLVQDVVYETLLLSQRKQLHEQVGAAIEALYADRLEEQYEALAGHYSIGGNFRKALHFHVHAGEKSLWRFALRAAQAHLSRAISVPEQWRTGADLSLLYRMHFSYGQVLSNLAQWGASVPQYRSAAEIAREMGNSELRARALFQCGLAALWGCKINECRAASAELESLSRDRPAELLGAVTLQAFFRLYGEGQAINSTLEKEREAEILYASEPHSRHVITAGLMLMSFKRWRGEHSGVDVISEHVLPLAKANGDMFSYLTAKWWHGMALADQGRIGEALQLFKEALAIGVAAGEKYTTPKIANTIAWIYHELGFYRAAIDQNRSSAAMIQDSLRQGRPDVLKIDVQISINLGENHLALADLAASRGYFLTAYENTKKPEYFFAQARWKPRCLLGLAELSLAESNAAQSQSYLSEVAKHGWTDGFPYRKYQARVNRIQGAIFAADGDSANAIEAYMRGLGQAKQVGYLPEVWRIQTALGDLRCSLGEPKLALPHYQAAAEAIKRVADGVTDVDLRSAFLASDFASRVLAMAKN